MHPQVTTRTTRLADMPYLQSLFAEDYMPLPSEEDLLQGLVAVNAEDEVVGFIRILQVVDSENPGGNGNYVYPVIVFKSWQGYGVGRVLIERAHEEYGELKLVACKASRDFYPKCGFKPLNWGQVAEQVADDCKRCPDVEQCEPQPFKLP